MQPLRAKAFPDHVFMPANEVVPGDVIFDTLVTLVVFTDRMRRVVIHRQGETPVLHYWGDLILVRERTLIRV